MKELKIAQQMIDSPWELSIGRFDAGTATLLDDSRTSIKFVKESENQVQVQDGVFQTRPGTVEYGAEKLGEASWLGVGEYISAAGVRELVAIGSTTGKAYKSVDGGSWTELTGGVFSTSSIPYFEQIDNKLIIINGFDNMTLYAGGTTIIRYTLLSAPASPAGNRGAGLSAGSHNNYWKVTALNDVGETEGSVEIFVTTNIARDAWNPASNQHIDLSWTAVPGANKYQIWYSIESGIELLLDESSTNSYRDDNSATVNPFYACPDFNTTGAPKFAKIGKAGDRLWGIGDPDNPWTLYWGGLGQFILNFSPGYGGGWTMLEYGGREKPAWIDSFRSGKGDEMATVLCDSPDGIGATWQVGLYEATVGDVVFTAPVKSKIVGTAGTKSPRTAILAGDTIMFMNALGVFSMGNKPQITNVLANDELSQNIRPSYRDLDISKACMIWHDGKVFFSASTQKGGENDIIFIFDLERKNWSWKWTIGVRQFLRYTDNDGNTHFLGVPSNGTKLWEFSDNVSGDLGKPFYQSVITGLIPVDPNDFTAFSNVDEAFVSLGRPKGVILFEVLGIEKNKGYASAASREITDTAAVGEYWTGEWGEITLAEEEEAPKTYEQANSKKSKQVGRELGAVQCKISSSAADTRWTLFGFFLKGTRSPTDTPNSWRK